MSGEQSKEEIDRQLEQRDGQLPAHLDPANPDNKGSGQGLTRDHLFGPEDIQAPFGKEAKDGEDEDKDKEADLDPDQGRKGEESDEAGDEDEVESGQEDEAQDDDELEDGDEADDAGQDEEDDEEDEAAGKDKAKVWDKRRQRQDQKIASLTKELADVKALLTAKAAKGGAHEDEAGDVADEDDGLEELDLPEADEFDDPDALAAERKRIAAHNRLVKATRDSRQELKALRSEKAQERAQAANKAAFEDILEDCDKRYGKEYRKAAIDQVRTLWKREGFGPGNYPSAESTRAAVRGVYAELKAADVIAGKKAGGNRAAVKTAKTATAGKLHGASRSLITSGSLTTSNEQALQEVMAELGPRRRR